MRVCVRVCVNVCVFILCVSSIWTCVYALCSSAYEYMYKCVGVSVCVWVSVCTYVHVHCISHIWVFCRGCNYTRSSCIKRIINAMCNSTVQRCTMYIILSSFAYTDSFHRYAKCVRTASATYFPRIVNQHLSFISMLAMYTHLVLLILVVFGRSLNFFGLTCFISN